MCSLVAHETRVGKFEERRARVANALPKSDALRTGARTLHGPDPCLRNIQEPTGLFASEEFRRYCRGRGDAVGHRGTCLEVYCFVRRSQPTRTGGSPDARRLDFNFQNITGRQMATRTVRVGG